ncbi:TetR/AcrR family transcriptional regulator [Mycobacterium colombiense]|uniref:TetR/AcrR family transcriptional regulator n=1 Tax=Mycobacterium colombiense TaxID=339268 RepID=UPI0020A24527|nr:TetR/AcrR family transcriptional regulator [Mycobacterium colombiense]
MTTTKSAVTRGAIMEAARNIFARKGYHGTSVTDITEGLHVRRANFYYYFRDKEQLFIELGTETYREVLAVIDAFDVMSDRPVLEEVRRWVDAYFEYLDRNGAFVARALGDSPEDPEFRATVARVHKKSARRLGTYVGARSAAGFNSHVALGMSLMAMLERSWLLLNTADVGMTSESAANSSAEILTQLMR